MKFGVHLPDAGNIATKENLVSVAKLADELRFDSVFSSDHIAWPDPESLKSKYPYNDEGDFIPVDTPWLDCIGSLIYIAGVTEHVKLGTTVIILGYRPVIQQAKLWATLDVLSGGRAILGVGVGWMKEEFETLGMPYDRRGKRADEFLEIFEVLFSEKRPEFEGAFTKFGPVGFEPKPVNGHIPIWVGGHSQKAYERTAKYGDAWHAAFGSPEDIKEQWLGVTGECEKLGRDPSEIELTALLGIEFDGRVEGNGWFGGSSAEITESLLAYKDIGITHLVCWFTGSPAKRLASIQRFHEEVRPNLS